MTAFSDTPDDRENVTVAQTEIYDGDTGEDSDGSVPFVQLVGDGRGKSTVAGDGAHAKVTVDEDGVTVTVSADLEDADRLLDRDMLFVQLSAKDIDAEGL